MMQAMIAGLGCYVLPDRASSSRAGIDHGIEAERIGLGAVWASERWGTKESGAFPEAYRLTKGAL